VASTHAFVFNCGTRVFNYVRSNFSKAGGSRVKVGYSVLRHTSVRPFIAAIVIFLGLFAILRSGDYLAVNHPERSDVIVVLAGDHNDLRYWHALELLREGYGQQMVVDASADRIYGRTYAQHAADFVTQSAGDEKSRTRICAITNDSTVQEASDIRTCLAQMNPAPQSALLVTSDFHTRRALSILRSRLPQYRWSVAAVNDTAIFGQPWWRHREWTKTWLYEWEKLVWWRLFESWRR
jgi:uncharacterized SAM-binding protein YcdF (DUF218 family)